MKFIIFLSIFGFYNSNYGFQTILGNFLGPNSVAINLNSQIQKKCNSSTVLCNGMKDCQDGSDELPELCQQSRSKSRWCKIPQPKDEAKYIVKCGKYTYEYITDFIPEMCSLLVHCSFQNDVHFRNPPEEFLCTNKTWLPTTPSCSKPRQALSDKPNLKTRCFYLGKEVSCYNSLRLTDQTAPQRKMFNQSVILTSKCYCNDEKILCNEFSNRIISNNHSTHEFIFKCYCYDLEIGCSDFSRCRKCYCNGKEMPCDDLFKCKPQIDKQLIPELVSKYRCNGQEIPCNEISKCGIQPNERLTLDQFSDEVDEGIEYLVQSDMDLTCYCQDEEIPCSEFINCKLPTNEKLMSEQPPDMVNDGIKYLA